MNFKLFLWYNKYDTRVLDIFLSKLKLFALILISLLLL